MSGACAAGLLVGAEDRLGGKGLVICIYQDNNKKTVRLLDSRYEAELFQVIDGACLVKVRFVFNIGNLLSFILLNSDHHLC
jgi:hypothetical protein